MNLKKMERQNQAIRSLCNTETETQEEQKSFPSQSLIPLFSVTQNKDVEGNSKVEKITKKEVRCISLVLFNFKD